MSAGLIHFLDKELLDEHVFTANDTVSVPVGVTQAIIVGFGGGGGAALNRGGYGSIKTNRIVNLTPGELLTITVGAGGLGENDGGGGGFANGQRGGDSIVSGATSGEVYRAIGAAGANFRSSIPTEFGISLLPGGSSTANDEKGSFNLEGDYEGGTPNGSVPSGAAGPEGDGADAVASGAGTAAGANTGAGGGATGSGAAIYGAGGSGKIYVYFINPE